MFFKSSFFAKSSFFRLFFTLFGIGAVLLCWMWSCVEQNNFTEYQGIKKEEQALRQVIEQWNSLWLELERHTEGYRPPVAARAYAYIAIAGYESALPVFPKKQSIYTLLTKQNLPTFSSNTAFYSPVALNSAYAYLFKKTFLTSELAHWQKISALERQFNQTFAAEIDSSTFALTQQYGLTVASAIWQWSLTDTIGHQGVLKNFDPTYPISNQKETWKPDTDHPMYALLPQWGKARSFFLDSNTRLARPPASYSEELTSTYYKQMFEVYSLTSPISKENKWIAEFWSDDHTGLTFTPSGRWISIAQQLIVQQNTSAEQALELYAKLGMSLCDASIACWYSKYSYNVERPKQYIQRVINPNWVALSDSPPFPSYPSGHATFGATATTILSTFYGDNIHFTDKSHINRTEFNGTPRTFTSFQEMDSENAYSRLVLGVHTRMDCEEGLRLGKSVAQRIANLNLKKEP